MKRIALFLLTNIAVMAVLAIVASLLGLNLKGTNFVSLLAISAVFGFGGSLISLLLSKTLTKRSMRVRVIDPQHPGGSTEAWLVQTVERLARRANIDMPEVGIYEGAPNAFATGARKNAALVAVSTGILRSMNRDELEAVLGHEIAHVANGDMVTLTLIQGVVNTFVFFLARVIGQTLFREGRQGGSGIGSQLVVVVMQVVLGFLASAIVAWFSRQREYRADAGAAQYLGQPNTMIAALMRLGGQEPGELPENMRAMGIAGGRLSSLFASHPAIEDRIAALKNRRRS
jgi:heat shock protein HtpX